MKTLVSEQTTHAHTGHDVGIRMGYSPTRLHTRKVQNFSLEESIFSRLSTRGPSCAPVLRARIWEQMVPHLDLPRQVRPVANAGRLHPCQPSLHVAVTEPAHVRGVVRIAPTAEGDDISNWAVRSEEILTFCDGARWTVLHLSTPLTA